MATRNDSKLRNDVRRRTKVLRQRIAAMDVIATGTVQTRTKTCGREGCVCMANTSARHGPYHEWTRRRDGRLVTTSLDAEQAALLTEAIENRREVEGLLSRWEHEVEARVLSRTQRNP